MRAIFKYPVVTLLFTLLCTGLNAQTDRREVRAGNRQFRKENWKKAEIEYRKAQEKDTASFAANYNLANALYKEGSFDEAGKSLDRLKEQAPASVNGADYYYNQGNVAVQKKDWGAAVEAYRQSLLRNPDDLEAKENYAYAKLMLKNQGGGGGNDKNQDQNQNQNQDQQDKNQNQDQNQGQDQNQDQQDKDQDQNQNRQNQDQNQQGQGQGDAKISPQQAQQMLKAIQAREKETQDKVNREKAALLKSRQKDKNW